MEQELSPGGTGAESWWCYYDNRQQRELVGSCDECYANHGYVGTQCVRNTSGGGDGNCTARQTLMRAPTETAFEALVLDQIPELMAKELLAASPERAASAFAPGSEPGAVTLTASGRRAIAEAVAENISEIAPTVRTALEVRDQVLAKTERGKELTRLYYANVAEMNAVAARDPDIISDFRATWMRLQPFAAGLVEAARGKRSARRYTHDDHQAAKQLLQRYRANSKNKAFQSAIDEAQAELDGFVGLAADKAFTKLRDAPPHR